MTQRTIFGYPAELKLFVRTEWVDVSDAIAIDNEGISVNEDRLLARVEAAINAQNQPVPPTKPPTGATDDR